MKISILTVFAGIFLVMVFFSFTMAGPKLSIPEPEFNFGYVPQAAKAYQQSKALVSITLPPIIPAGGSADLSIK